MVNQLANETPQQSNHILMTTGIFILFSLLMYIATHVAIPYAAQNFALPSVLGWFIFAAFLVFIPMTLLSIYLVRMRMNENHSLKGLLSELGFKRMNREDWKATGIVLAFIGIASAIITGMIFLISGEIDMNPSFMTYEGVSAGTYWYLGVWLFMFTFNILGEEMIWRGYILPLQEREFGNYAFVTHGLLYCLFHLPFGFPLFFTFIPILFGLPYVKQQTGNTTTSLIIHALINGMGFLSISFGLI